MNNTTNEPRYKVGDKVTVALINKDPLMPENSYKIKCEYIGKEFIIRAVNPYNFSYEEPHYSLGVEFVFFEKELALTESLVFNEFQKSQLMPGLLLELRCGIKLIMLGNGDLYAENFEAKFKLDDYTENLLYLPAVGYANPAMDIVKIYVTSERLFSQVFINKLATTLIWKRKDVDINQEYIPKLTKENIEQLLGYKFELVT